MALLHENGELRGNDWTWVRDFFKVLLKFWAWFNKKNRNKKDAFFAEIINLSSRIYLCLFTSERHHNSIIIFTFRFKTRQVFVVHCAWSRFYAHFGISRSIWPKLKKFIFYAKMIQLTWNCKIVNKLTSSKPCAIFTPAG